MPQPPASSVMAVPTSRRPRWQHEPTSTASHPDVVPSKALPPLSSLDRMGNGEHLGQCPTCGGHRWWDNRSRKSMGEMSRSQPDFVCTDCRHGRWNDGRQQAGRPTTRRAPSTTVTVVPTVDRPSGASQRVMTCAAVKPRWNAVPKRCDGRLTVLWTPFGRHRRRGQAGVQSVPRHDQGRAAVPRWCRARTRLLPAAPSSPVMPWDAHQRTARDPPERASDLGFLAARTGFEPVPPP